MKIAIEIYTTEAKTWHSDDLILIDPDWRYCTLQLHREGFTCINWNDGNDFFFFRQQLEISLLCSRFRGVKSHISPFREYQKRRWTFKKKITYAFIWRSLSEYPPSCPSKHECSRIPGGTRYKRDVQKIPLNSPDIRSLEWNYFETGKRISPVVVWGLGHQSPIAPYLDIYSYVYYSV